MKYTTKRSVRKPRHYPGEEAGTAVASYLRTPKGGQSDHRLVVSFTEVLLKQLEHGHFRRWPYPFPKDSEQSFRDWESGEDKLFSEITFMPNPLLCLEHGRYRFQIRWQAIRRGRYLHRTLGHAIMQVLDLAEHGLLHRLRKCLECREWFYAKRENHTNCSASCRDAAFRKTPEGRKARAKYMREYRKQPSHKKPIGKERTR